VEKHLGVLEQIPEAKQVYLALANAALKHLPAKNKKQLSGLLKKHLGHSKEVTSQ
jgi:hypothetical protein